MYGGPVGDIFGKITVVTVPNFSESGFPRTVLDIRSDRQRTRRDAGQVSPYTISHCSFLPSWQHYTISLQKSRLINEVFSLDSL